MKKIFLSALSLMLIAAMAACGRAASASQTPSGSGQTSGAEAVYTGQVMRLFEDAALIGGEDGGLFTLGLKDIPITGADGQPADSDAVLPGCTVDVGYDGSVLESWPEQFGSPAYLRVVSAGDDLVGLYVQALEDLWAEDPGLNTGAQAIYLNLESCGNLTDAEKTAVRYILWCDTGVEVFPLPSDAEMKAEGRMDADGNLIDCVGMAVTVHESDADRFSFDASKGRGPLAVYTFNGCRAELKDGRWSYVVGTETIS